MRNNNQHLSSIKTKLQSQVKQALANLSLEGMHPSKEMLDDIELWTSKKISEQEFISRGLRKQNGHNAQK